MSVHLFTVYGLVHPTSHQTRTKSVQIRSVFAGKNRASALSVHLSILYGLVHLTSHQKRTKSVQIRSFIFRLSLECPFIHSLRTGPPPVSLRTGLVLSLRGLRLSLWEGISSCHDRDIARFPPHLPDCMPPHLPQKLCVLHACREAVEGALPPFSHKPKRSLPGFRPEHGCDGVHTRPRV